MLTLPVVSGVQKFQALRATAATRVPQRVRVAASGAAEPDAAAAPGAPAQSGAGDHRWRGPRRR